MSAVPDGRPLGRWRVLSTGILIGVAVAFLASGVLTASSLDLYGFDFRFQYFGGAHSVAEGKPLYPPLDDPALEEVKAYVYPPLTAVVLVPFTVVPEDVAVVAAIIASLAAVLAALALVGVRDARCYLAVLASAPIWNILETANLSGVLALGVALAWRFRESTRPLASILGLATAAKFFLWPLLVWVAATKRSLAAVLGLVVTIVTTIAAWAVIGFQGFTGYPALLGKVYDIHAEESYSFVGVAASLGFDPVVGRVSMLCIGGVLLASCVRFGRQGDDRRAFSCALVAALALTPIVWQHYIVLLLVPLGIARPRFSAVWVLPMVLWVSPRSGNGEGLEPILLAVATAALLALILVRPRGEAPLRRIWRLNGVPRTQ